MYFYRLYNQIYYECFSMFFFYVRQWSRSLNPLFILSVVCDICFLVIILAYICFLWLPCSIMYVTVQIKKVGSVTFYSLLPISYLGCDCPLNFSYIDPSPSCPCERKRAVDNKRRCFIAYRGWGSDGGTLPATPGYSTTP